MFDKIKDLVTANPFTAGVVGGVAATLTTVGAIKLTNKLLVSRQAKKLANTMAEAEAAQATEAKAN